MWDEISLSPSEQREQRLLYVQDPSYEIIAYPERKSYWLQTRMLKLTGGNWNYEKRVAIDSDKIIRDFLGVKCPDWFENADSIREHCLPYKPEIDKSPKLIVGLTHDILCEIPGWDEAATTKLLDDATTSSCIASAFAFYQRLHIRFQGRHRPKVWSLVYGSFFESIWDEEFLDNGISVEYGPIWALHEIRSESVQANHAFERLRITPDVAFGIYVPAVTLEDRLNASYEDMLNPEMNIAFDALHGPGQTVHLPMLVVEYVTTPGLEGTDTERLEGLSQHKMHLAMSMMSASGLYKAMGIAYPVFGLLVHKFDIEVFAYLTLSSRDGGEEMQECVAGLGYVKPQAKFSMKNVSDAVRFRMFLHNLVGHATKLRESVAVARPALLKSIQNSTYHRWKLTELPERPKSPVEPLVIADWARNVES